METFQERLRILYAYLAREFNTSSTADCMGLSHRLQAFYQQSRPEKRD